ncbi:kynureninase [Acetobacteraceae bacterium KSS8]|uniref:Kynureninase n=1 Tax=Endosaccharibacter trunci TaxID=2812733 RepID=A0ABT1W783_9PROT|nr:kynureninase [Acetobacteraceae bacterium KSS8]
MNRIEREDALELDRADRLAAFRDRFVLPEGRLYLDGNSLGALPRATSDAVQRVVSAQWGQDLIAGWNAHDWIGLPQRIGAAIAPLIGAKPDEVLVCDSTSVNLFKLIAGALLLRPERSVILSEPGNFPTDLYVAEGVAALRGGVRIDLHEADSIAEAIDETTALVLLTHVHYTTGRMLDMAAITRAAHAKGALVLWDLSHSTGAVPVALNESGADLAVGCGYKYLNGGPGAPAFLFVAEALQTQIRQPLSGWMGHDSPFAFEDSYRPAARLDRFLCGTPSVIGMAALEAGVAQFRDVDLPALFAKGRALSALLVRLMGERCAGFGFQLASPGNAEERGCHVSFRHADAYPVCQALIARGVVGDFRAPDRLRFGMAPLYTRFADVFDAVAHLETVMRDRLWTEPRFQLRGRVT